MFKDIKRIVVIAGCQRSGTTLVGQILGAHPDALMLDEPDGLYEWFNAEIRESPHAKNLLYKLINQSKSKYRSEHQKILSDAAGNPIGNLNLTHLILKAPNLTYNYKELPILNIPVSIIYPVRDPRSVVASMLKLKHIPMVENQIKLIRQNKELMVRFRDELTLLEDSEVRLYAKMALIWRIKTALYDRFLECGLPTFVFKYEDLINETEKTVVNIAQHAGLRFDDLMMSHEIVYKGFGPGMTDRSRPIDNLSIDSWIENLNEEQDKEILRIAGKLAEKFNYSKRI